MLRSTINLIIICFSVLCNAEEFNYNGTEIDEKEFNNLYEEQKNILLSDGKKVYDLRVGCRYKFIKDPNVSSKYSSRTNGTIKGEIYKIINKSTFLLKVGRTAFYVSGNIDTSNLEEKSEFVGKVAYSGKFKYHHGNGKSTVLTKIVNLTPISKEQFKNFIHSHFLYKYKKTEKKVVARNYLCPKCRGKGSYLTSINNDGRVKSKWEKCDECNQKGVVAGKYKQQITWERMKVECSFSF